MENGATTTSGYLPTTDRPRWFLVQEPTKPQVDAAAEVGMKIHHGGENGKWFWWLKYDRDVSHLGIDQYAHSRSMSVADRVIKPGSKDDHANPSRVERDAMWAQGREALGKFIDQMDGTNRERAVLLHNIAPVIVAIEQGDLPAAIQAALGVGINKDVKDRLIGLLEDEMIYWPDFQRRDSTSADRTIPHHVPAEPSNSGTSLTISGSGTTSGTSLTISASVTAGGATG